ncbi:MAG: glutamyl-tRNA reductase [Magnetococcales bacterium]|nr:glutamyl-tRNA reductase [Magnetococcales bacterium]
MKIVALGLSHKTAPVALRERFSFSAAELTQRLPELLAKECIAEAVILSTCNRVEIYLATQQDDIAIAETALWLADVHEVPAAQLESHLYIKSDQQAVQHSFRVTASLDSLVVGEPQILGQVKEAYHLAAQAQSTGAILNRLFHHAFRTAKRVRSETTIAENAVSVASAAVSLAKKIFGRLQGQSCLLIGAGEMCELAAQHLVTNGIDQVLVTNRTFSRAETLAKQFDGEAFPLEEVAQQLHRADIVLSSTGAAKPIINAAMVRNALKQRRYQPMFLIDIAVPRDLDPAIDQVDSAFLYDIDDLHQIVEKNIQGRTQIAQQAEKIVQQEVMAFQRWLDTLSVTPTIVSLRNRFEEIRDQEIAKAVSGWSDLSDEDRKRLEEMGRRLVNKLLHVPTKGLKKLSAEENGDLYLDAARKLFQL